MRAAARGLARGRRLQADHEAGPPDREPPLARYGARFLEPRTGASGPIVQLCADAASPGVSRSGDTKPHPAPLRLNGCA